jgi:hypothetical protein
MRGNKEPPPGLATVTAPSMQQRPRIRNGLYSFEAKALDGMEGGDHGVVVLRDGTIRGGTSFFYLIYSCSNGKWNGEMTSQEHTQTSATRLLARRIVHIGFSGTYADDGAEIDATALVGKRSIRYDAIFGLLLAD